MHLLISLSALFISTIFVQMGIGSMRPFDAISGEALGFSTIEIGLIASGHFFGFLLGCLFSPQIVRRSGHSRAFAVMAVIAVISIVAHPLLPDAIFWMAVRILSGFSIAGCYTVIESWLQAKLQNTDRGRIFGIYRMVDLVGQVLANGIIATLAPAAYVSYNLIAIIMCLAVLPLGLTQSKEPALPAQVSYRPLYAYNVSPLAAFGVIIAGLSTSTFGSVGPVYAIKVGLDISQIALFLVFSTFGGLLSQLPAGILADKFSRRSVLLAFSIMATSLCLCMILPASDATIGGIPVIYIMSFLFGFTTFPIYSICAAHASDFVAPDEMLPLSASLIFLYASGAIISPLAAGWIMTKFGAEMMFGFIAAAHFVLMIYTIMRRFARPAEARRSYTYIPRTTLFIAETLKQRLHSKRNR